MRARPRIAALPRRLPSNPYCALLYGAVERLGVEVVEGASGVRWLLRARRRVAVLHFHWPERHFDPRRLASAVAFVLRLLLARLLGYRLVWTVHNLRPHEGDTPGHRLVRAALLRLATPIAHCEAARRALGRAAARAVVVPHGSYVGWYPNRVGARAARARLGLAADARVLACFGQIRPYKGIEQLLRAFAAIPDPDVRLVIAGEPVGGADARVLAVGDPRVQLVLGRIPDDEVQVVVNAADVMVVPYRDVLTSGAAMLAFSFGRGIIAPRLGCLADLAETGAAILYDPDEPGALAAALRRGLAADATALGGAARRLARALSWEAIARRHLAVYGLAPTLALVSGRDGAPAARSALRKG
ncbi:MAG TPA: glycosyltransferase [Candidatus Binatia bacterium]|nr:glycosyltransferase [Candidatus Binatia bacterium]